MESSPLTKKQLEQRLLTLHNASLELVQDVTIDSLLERIAHLACQEAEAQYAAVSVQDEKGGLEKFITVGMSRNEIDEIPHPPRGLGMIGAMMKSKVAMRVADISSDPRSAGFPTGHPKMSTFLGVPILQGNRTLGQIYLTNKLNGQEFSDDDQQIIEMLAAYASAAIANAWLYKDLIQRDRILTRRNENLALLDQLASTLANTTETNQILEKCLSQLMDYLRLEAGEFFLRQEDGRNLNLVVHRGNSGNKLWKRDQFVLGEGVVGKVAKSGSPVLLDLAEDDPSDLNPETRAQGIHQIAVVPLNGRRGAMGAMCVATCAPQPLDELEVQFLQAIGSWTATTIENVRLNVSGRRLAVLEERERIGMDLHDGIIQSIYAVGLTLEHARLLMKESPEQSTKRIEQAIKDLNSTIRDIRAYILDLRPRHLHNEDLISGITRLMTEFRANTLVEVKLQGPTEDLSTLPNNQAVALFHICQEALANIAKHAHAHHVDVVVWTTNDRLLLEIRDDGNGFNLETIKKTIGHGLSNMETRATNAGGEVDITSEIGNGTTILAWVPIPEDESLIVE
jgi:two-component system, NarL family, sensor histidine kinase DevS